MDENYFLISPEIQQALKNKKPIVALESAVITHGLPYPVNYELANTMEEIVKSGGGNPATIAIMNGIIKIGMALEEIKALAQTKNPIKVSPRNIAIAVLNGLCGGTTVAGTLQIAAQAGICVFATGGIGGVHLHSQFDVSADLPMLSKTRMVVVCAGAKAILDLPATLEVLETYGVPVIGYQTDEFPAFYSQKSGLGVDYKANDVDEIIKLARIHWECGNNSSILVTVPIPKKFEIQAKTVEAALDFAIRDADQAHLHGSEITPYLLQKMNEYTGGKTLESNLELLKNNAKIATQIAIGFSKIG